MAVELPQFWKGQLSSLRAFVKFIAGAEQPFRVVVSEDLTSMFGI
jgi:hypothetical protein